MDRTYQPKSFEAKWYEHWMSHRLFEAGRDPQRKVPFTVMMPPPNVTSQLHMGHGTGYTMQDILVRWKRMCGYDALWVPGTDHAGIATQMMVEKALLEQEGKTKHDLGREKFFERLSAWKDKYGGTIIEQFKAMGFSCDWSRLAYTMDESLSHAVRKIFVDLFQEGLIYRGERLVNWDPVLKTAVSDDEVFNEELTGSLYYIRYPYEDGSGHLLVATTRPETMLGDTAVAVHPDDERYKDLHGKQVRLPLCDRLIPVVVDDYVKMEFGTGCVKITPAHDPNDFALGKRHSLPIINVMNEDATINDAAPAEFRGLDRFKARSLIVKRLKELDLFEREDKHKHAVPHSDRSKAVIEPRLSKQWFVHMPKLAEPAIQAAKTGDLNFFPENWRKTYLYWLENIQDWCISRQLWWGHRIPIWHCNACESYTTGMQDPSACSQCQSTDIRQDEDVLDTWFSSWLWPVSTLGWPEENPPDLARYYPTDVLITAPEIIFLWVARMVMVGYYTKGLSPFKDVFLTATVCDEKGRKFSKTLGNGIDPLTVIDRYGTDAVRFTAVHLAPLGGRIRMSESDFEVGAKFINKIWNAARFVLSKLAVQHGGEDGSEAASDGNFDTSKIAVRAFDEAKLHRYQKWLLVEFGKTCAEVNLKFGQYRINEAVHSLYHFIWGSLCDWGIELSKSQLEGSAEERDQAFSVLTYLLDGAMRLASPIMPFVAEEIWQKLPKHPAWDRPASLVIAKFPDPNKGAAEFLQQKSTAHAEFAAVMTLISSIRAMRAAAKVPPKVPTPVFVTCEKELEPLFRAEEGAILQLAKVSTLALNGSAERPVECLVEVGKGFQCYLPVAGLMDVGAEIKRIDGESQRIRKILGGLEAKLANEQFVKNAPEDVLAQTRAQFTNMSEQLKHLDENRKALGA